MYGLSKTTAGGSPFQMKIIIKKHQEKKHHY